MNDDSIRDLLGPYMDDDLPAEARRRVEEALLASPALAWEVQSLKITRERLRADIGEVVASDALRTRTLRGLYADNPHVQCETSETIEPAQYTLPIRL